jgi:hypothetical protein
MDDSRFVGLSGKWSAGVRRIGERWGSELGSVGRRFFLKISSGMERAGNREDTTAVGTQARAVESSMVGGLGRVKERAACELPNREYRKSFNR